MPPQDEGKQATDINEVKQDRKTQVWQGSLKLQLLIAHLTLHTAGCVMHVA